MYLNSNYERASLEYRYPSLQLPRLQTVHSYGSGEKLILQPMLVFMTFTSL